MAYSGPVFSFEQNSADPLVERLIWGTDAIEHKDSSEQRNQFRLDPRRQIEFSVLASGVERQAIDNFLWGRMGADVMLPLWSDVQTLTTTASSGQPTVTVPTTYYDFDNSQYCCLWRDWNNYEVVQISSFTSSAITLSENLTSTWPANVTAVLPARLARISQKQSSARYGGCSGASWRVAFDVDEGAYSTNRITSISPSTHNSIDVYDSDPDCSEALPLDLDGAFGIVDPGTGKVYVDSSAKVYPANIFQYADTFFTRADVSAFLGFLARRNGRRVPFYLSTQEDDFTPTAVDSGVTGWLTYTSNGFDGVYNGITRRDISIRYLQQGLLNAPGTELRKRILDVQTLGGGLERLQINVETIGTGDFDKFKVSYLKYCRLESDTVEIEWLGDRTNVGARVKMVMRELPNYPS